jgi:HK97 family phage portal protein
MNGIGFANLFRPNNAAPGATASRGRIAAPTNVDALDIESYLRTFGSVGVIFAIVSRISEAVAAVEWNIYKSDDKLEETPLKSHIALDLWNNPNPFYNRADFVETVMQHFDLSGESDWFVGYPEAAPKMTRPLELWPIRPDKILPVPNAKTFLDGWAYRDASFGYVPWRLNEVIQLKRPNPLDPYRGIGPVAAAMIDVYGEKAAAAYNNAFFKNSAEPGGVIMFDERLPDEEYDEFIERWREQHQGAGNAHRVAVLERAQWIERKYTMHDMEFQEGRKNNHNFIRQAFGYPKSMLGDTEDVNKASAIAGEYVFVRWIVKTRLDRLKNALNYKLLPLFGNEGKGVKFGYSNPNPNDSDAERLDRDSDANRVKILTDAGYDPAAVLDFVGLPPMSNTPKPTPALAAPAAEPAKPKA